MIFIMDSDTCTMCVPFPPTTIASGGGISEVKPEGMSKSQWKKRLKQKRYEESKSEWRKKQKEKQKGKRKQTSDTSCDGALQVKRKKMSDDGASKISVAIELQYEQIMSDKDIKKLIKQCQRCYAANRRSESPLQLYFTSYTGRMKERMEGTNQGVQNWDVHFRERSYLEEFDKSSTIFLAAESDNVLTNLDETKVYVIGGLVDHNHYKAFTSVIPERKVKNKNPCTEEEKIKDEREDKQKGKDEEKELGETEAKI